MSDEQSPTLEQSVGVRIKLAREARDWSQARLAQEAGITENTVLSAERGRRKTRPEKVRAMLDALGMASPPDSIIDLTDKPADVRLFLRVVSARLAALDDAERLRVMNEIYAHILESHPIDS